MNYSYFKNFIHVKARIITEDLTSLVSSLQKQEDASKFMLSLYGVMLSEQFILLDESLSYKIYDFINHISFRFKKDINIRTYRKVIADRIIKLMNKTLEEKKKIIKDIIQMEKDERNIPSNFNIGKEEILKMYQLDFKNHSIITQNNGLTSEVDLFYFLTTMNKIWSNYSDISEALNFKIGFEVAINDFNLEDKDPYTLNYLIHTKEFFDSYKKDKRVLSKKIIPFPIDESISS